MEMAYSFLSKCETDGIRTANHTVDTASRADLRVMGSVSGGPCVGCEIGDALHLCIGESGQDVSEVGAQRDLEPTAAFDHGEDRGPTRSGLLAADVDPVFSANRKKNNNITTIFLLSPSPAWPTHGDETGVAAAALEHAMPAGYENR
jgi:hypothetical protein